MSSGNSSAATINPVANTKPVNPPTRITLRSDADGIRVANGRGHEVKIAVSPSTEGFNPYELLGAALAVCSSLNLRREVREAGVAGDISHFELKIESIRSEGKPSRVERVELVADIAGDVPVDVKAGILARAEQACTIANTLRNPVIVSASLAD